MTDRELLEKAAKAAGIELTDHEGVFYVQRSLVHSREWNPLIDEGDALRLAVDRSMEICPEEELLAIFIYTDDRPACTCEKWADHPDRNSAWRRCIVRAAASIGETP